MKLKLSAIPDDKPVKLSLELPAEIHRDLVAYAEALSRQTGQKLEPAKLVPPMLARFMSTDRAFARLQRDKRAPSQLSRTPTARAVAVMTPMPGMVRSRRLTALASWHARMAFSIDFTRTCKSSTCAMISSTHPRMASGNSVREALWARAYSSGIFHTPYGATRPNSASCPRSEFTGIVRCRTKRSRVRCSIRDRLLFGSLDRDETHGRPGHRLADCLRIDGVVLTALNVRLDVARRHQSNVVPEQCQLPGQMVCRSAGLDAHQAGRLLSEEFQHLFPPKLLADDHLAGGIDPVVLKDVLGKIKTNGDSRHRG